MRRWAAKKKSHPWTADTVRKADKNFKPTSPAFESVHNVPISDKMGLVTLKAGQTKARWTHPTG